MSYVGNPLATAFAPRVKQDLTGQSGTSFTLSHAVSSANDLSVYINHVRQEPTTAYTVDYTTLTTTGSVASTDDFYIIFDELALQSIAHDEFTAMKATSGTFTGAITTTQLASSGPISGTTLSASSTTTLQDDVTFTGANYNVVWDKSDNALEFADDAKLTFGDSADLTIRHDNGGSTYIEETGSGHLIIKADDLFLQNAAGTQNMAFFQDGGVVQLRHNNQTKFQTSSTGATVTGTLTATTLAGTLSTAAQTNITSVGTLTNLRTSDIVGIGQASPTSPNGATAFLHIGNGDEQDVGIVLQDAVETWEIYQNDNLHFRYGTTDVMTMQRTTGNIGLGGLQSASFTSNNGIHLADNYKIGFGVGGNSRPDFQLGYSSSADRLHLACGFGSDDADVQIDTGGRIGLGAVGSGAINDNIFIKDTSPVIKLEETSSGGSKRLAIAVSASGTPFISAEQSGGLIDFFCTGAHTARVHSQGVIGQTAGSSAQFPLQSKCLGTSNSASNSLYLVHFTNHYDTTSQFIQASFYGSGTNFNRFVVYSNGATYNSSNTYGNISDERLKSDITDAKSQWDDIKNIKVRNFKKYDTGDAVQLGVVSQELEKVSPNLVEEVDPSEADIKHNSVFGTVYKDGDDIPEGKEVGNVKEVKEKVKGVKYSILYMKAVKALQEAMERIEILEDKVKILESK